MEPHIRELIASEERRRTLPPGSLGHLLPAVQQFVQGIFDEQQRRALPPGTLAGLLPGLLQLLQTILDVAQKYIPTAPKA